MITKIQNLLLIVLLLLFYSCTEEPIAEKKYSQIISNSNMVSQIDSTTSNNIHQSEYQNGSEKISTQKFFYPNMSHCGGALYGIYSNNELIRIESTYGSEMGYSSKNIDFENGRITKINYREYYGDQDKYFEQYPNVDTIDFQKMTFTDTLYVLEFGDKKSFKKYAGKKLIATTINADLVNRLLKCVETMQSELASEKQLVKD